MITAAVLGPEKFKEFQKKIEDLAAFLNSKNYGYYVKDGCIEDFDLRIWFDICETKAEEAQDVQ